MKRLGGNTIESIALALFCTFAPLSHAQTQSADDQTQASASVDIEVAYRRLRADVDLQFDLPGGDIEEEDEPEPRGESWLARLIEALAPFARIFIWGAAGLVVLGIVGFVVQSIRDTRFQRREREAQGDPDAPAPYEPEAAAVRTLLGQVDRLAAHGRFREAVHMLLFRAIEDIDRARPGEVRRSLTSREIARLPGLTTRTREAFVAIARINERGWFAGRDLSREQFETARAAYAQFDGRSRAEAQPRLSDLPGSLA